MIPEAVRKQVGRQLIQNLMATAHLDEETARRAAKALQPYLKTISTHSLSAITVEALMKLRAAVRYYGRNRIHLRKDMGKDTPFPLSFDQVTNFAKLRTFGLAVHADKTNPRSGWWLLTDRGNKFLAGELRIESKVYTFLGHPVHAEGAPAEKLVSINDYRDQLPKFETYQDFTAPRVERKPIETISMFG